MRETAPGVRLTIENLGPESRSSDRVLLDYDALIAPLGFGFPGESRPLWRDRMVLIADRGNPRLVDGALTLEDLAELPHAVPSFGPGVLTPADRAFGELGIERRVALQVTGFLPLPFVIAGTSMVALVPGEAGPDPHPRATARWCRSSRRSTRWCWPRGTGSPATGSPTRRTAGSSTGSTSWPARSPDARLTAHSQWLRFAAPCGPAR